MKTKILILTALLANTVCGLAQESAQSDDTKKYAQPVEHPSVYSPQVEAMMRYDNSSVNLNTGTVSLTVPLVEFDDPDFDLDVSITYSSDGFKPLQPDNFVGMGWRLNCGGVITREVHGIPDEFMGFPAAPNRGGYPANVSGYLAAAQPTANVLLSADSTWLDSNLRQTPVSAEGDWEAIVYMNNSWKELSPDIFRFSFGRHSGMFIMDGNNILVSSDTGQNYKVEFGPFTRRPENKNSGDVSMSITITTDDGYQYIFGGKYDAIEYTALRWSDITSESLEDHTTYMTFPALDAIQAKIGKRYNEPTAFHLSKVIAPNGRELIYRYQNPIPDSIHSEPEMFIIDHNRLPETGIENILKSYSVTPSLRAKGLENTVEQLDLSYSLTKTALIASIESDTQKIEFTYGSHANPFFCLDRHTTSGEYIYEYLSKCGARLENVLVRYNGNYLQESILSYKGNEARLKLESVDNSRTGKYNFEYYPCDMAKPLTMDIDKWGFWNGIGSNRYFRPDDDATINWERMEYNKEEGDRNREPSGKDVSANMLRSVTFPTGGSITYEYQPHDYSRYYEQSYETSYVPQIRTTSVARELAGGARLFKEIHNDGMDRNLYRTRVYEYSLDDGRSSGTLKTEGDNYMGMYVMTYNIIDKYGNALILPDNYELTHSSALSGHHILRNNGIGGHIEYSQVSEYDYDGSLMGFKADSVFRLSVSTLEELPETGVIHVSVGTNGPNEHLSSWTVSGASSMTAGTEASFEIRNQYGINVKSKTFGTSVETILIDPTKELPAGNYEIHYEVGTQSQFSFTADYPKRNEIGDSMSRKISRFSETPLVYEDRHFKPYDLIEHNLSKPNNIYESNARAFLDRYYSKPVDYSGLGGKLLGEEYYDAEGRLRKKVSNSYQTFTAGNAATINYYPIVPYSTTNNYYQVLRVPAYSTLPVSRTVTDFDESGAQFEQKETFTYNDEGYLYTSVSHDSGSRPVSVTYTYPSDHQDVVNNTMVSLNMLSPVITKTYKADSTEVIYRNETKYKLMDNMTENPDTRPMPVIESVKDTYGNKEPELRAEYMSYDCYGNPVWIISDNRSNVYLWGYSGKYLIAVIENATDLDVMSALNVESLSDISVMVTPDNNLGSTLRSALTDSMVSDYTYFPGIGLKSETGPDGRTIHYDYDESDRLSCRYYIEDDGQVSIIEKYEYNLLNE